VILSQIASLRQAQTDNIELFGQPQKRKRNNRTLVQILLSVWAKALRFFRDIYSPALACHPFGKMPELIKVSQQIL
jgi:hypothetical protein